MPEENFDQPGYPIPEKTIKAELKVVAEKIQKPGNLKQQKRGSARLDQEKLGVLRSELQAREKEQKDLLGKVTRRYQSSTRKFGEGVGTSQSFLNDKKEYGLLRATVRLFKRSGILAETGNVEIFRNEIGDYNVSPRTIIRGVAVVILSIPQMFAQALNVKQPLLRKLAGLSSPYPGLFTKEARKNYSPPPEYESGTFDSKGNLVES